LKKSSKKTFLPLFTPFKKFNILYTEPKIVILKTKNEAGKQVPYLNKYWYVKFSYRNPKTGKMQEFRLKKGINKYKTLKERKYAIKHLPHSCGTCFIRWLQSFSTKRNRCAERTNLHH
jgi:hypothetical protein